MTDVVVDKELNLPEIESLTSLERIRSEIHEECCLWLKTVFRKNLGASIERVIEFDKTADIKSYTETLYEHAKLMRMFGRVMSLFITDGVTKKYDEKLTRILLNKNDPDSVINILGPERQNEVESQLVGAISTLTFIDLLKKAGTSGLIKNLKLLDITTEQEIDVEDRVDILLNLGTKRGELPVIRLIQLKAGGNETYITKIDPNDLKENYLRVFSKRDAERMLAYATELQEKRNYIECFVVIVPGLHSEAVTNIFGIIRDNKAGRDIIDIFKKGALEEGLLPKSCIQN